MRWVDGSEAFWLWGNEDISEENIWQSWKVRFCIKRDRIFRRLLCSSGWRRQMRKGWELNLRTWLMEITEQFCCAINIFKIKKQKWSQANIKMKIIFHLPRWSFLEDNSYILCNNNLNKGGSSSWGITKSIFNIFSMYLCWNIELFHILKSDKQHT